MNNYRNNNEARRPSNVDTSKIYSLPLRNILRGSLHNSDKWARRGTLNHARKLLSKRDVKAFVDFLVATNLEEEVYGPFYCSELSHVLRLKSLLTPIALEIETYIQIERLNRDIERVRRMLELIILIDSSIVNRDYKSATYSLESFTNEFGYSANIAKKLSYIHSRVDQSISEDVDLRSNIKSQMDSHLRGRKSSLFSFYTNWMIDFFDTRSGVVENITRQLRWYEKREKKEALRTAVLRKTLFSCQYETLINESVFYYFGCTSAPDALIEMLCMLGKDECPQEVSKFFNSPVLRPLVKNIVHFNQESFPRSTDSEEQDEIDTYLFRLSAALPEVMSLQKYRASIDEVVMSRTRIDQKNSVIDRYKFFKNLHSLNDVLDSPDESNGDIDTYHNCSGGIFLRTIAVLYCIAKGKKLADLNANQVRILLSKTTGLYYFLKPEELSSISNKSVSGDIEEKVVTFLACVMLFDKDRSEDNEFRMRVGLQSLVELPEFSNKLINLLDWLARDTKSLSAVMVDLLDISLVEKLYLQFSTYSEVLRGREEICRWAAEHLDNKYYSELAERFSLDFKIRQIRGTIDDTRIYIDEMRFRQWLLENIAEEFRRFLRYQEILGSSLTEETETKNIDSGEIELGADFENGAELLFSDCILNSFNTFCHNKTFGVESYLSRRIRHGSLSGHLQAPVKNVIDRYRQDDRVCVDDISLLDSMYRDYSNSVLFLKDELLQYRSAQKQHGLFSSSIEVPASRRKVVADAKTQILWFYKGGVSQTQLITLIPDVCWSLIEIDLSVVRYQIKNYFRSVIRPAIRVAGRGKSDVQILSALENELNQIASSLFDEVSGWFHRPESSSMTVSVEELVNVVVKEINEYHPDSQLQLEISGAGKADVSGSTYQDLYDIFYVLFDNASRYSDVSSGLKVFVDFDVNSPGGKGAALKVEVKTSIKYGESDEKVSEAIASSLAEKNSADAMVREGKSGLGKIKWLVQSQLKPGEYKWNVSQGQFTFSVDLPIILMHEAIG